MSRSKMKKRTNLTIFALIILIGCSTTDTLPTNRQDIFKGTDAVTLHFLVNSPPAQVYENKPFRVGVKVTNIGAVEPASGVLLIGYEGGYLSLIGDNREYFNIEGRTLQAPYGKDEKFFFDFESGNVDNMSSHHRSLIFASACYEFKTHLAAEVCIDTDIYNERTAKKVCNVEDQSFTNQGAPIAVTKIEYDIIPDGDDMIKPIFRIHVQNAGNGKTLAKESTDRACSSESITKKDDLDMVNIKVRLGNKELECTPTPLHLQRDSDYVRCWLEDGISTTFITYKSLLEIELEYGYMHTISREVDIRKVI